MSIAVPPALTFRRQRAFTLTELAIVMFIMALLLGGMLLPLSAQQDIRARQETEKTLNETRDALLGFAVLNGRLPRPATSATDGIENPTSCADDAACSGYIPWATLGTGKTDGWNKLIRYSVTPAFANSSISLTSVANRTVQTRNGAALAYLAGSATCSTASQCVPAVIFSHGQFRWGTTTDGTSITDGSATNIDEDSNNSGPTAYISRTPASATDASGGEFDDLVTWVSANTLINRLVAAGKL